MRTRNLYMKSMRCPCGSLSHPALCASNKLAMLVTPCQPLLCTVSGSCWPRRSLRSIEGIIQRLELLRLLVDHSTMDAFGVAQVATDGAARVISSHYQCDVVLVILSDVITHVQVEDLPVCKTDDFVTILLNVLWKALPNSDDVPLVL
mmetsp:Transcript_19932/g.37492  ORF Transcript_19932/g.37492 Transcript_19932/m.37492 type:complete len:148 (+) Transcript_19932:74-517(+)